MKIDLTVAVTAEILGALAGATGAGSVPPAARFGHIGTHFDVMDKEFPLDNTERRGLIFDVRHVAGRAVEAADIDAAAVAAADFVIFHTGWLADKGYAGPEYFAGHPELSTALITWLTDRRVSMIGIDAPGIRRAAGHAEADQYCADRGIFVVENLAGLDALRREAAGRPFLVHTYPVRYQGLTGLPCRVVAEL